MPSRALFLALALLGTGHPAVAHGVYHWPLQKGDVNRTGNSPHLGPLTLSQGPTWRFQDPHADVARATPLVDDELNVYHTTSSGRFYKFSPHGELLWTFLWQDSVPTVPALMDGALYGSGKDGFLFAVDMKTGRERWRLQTSEKGVGGDTACLFAMNGTVLTATEASPSKFGGNTRVLAVTADGFMKWSYSVVEAPVYNFQASSPGDGTVVFQNQIGGVYRLDLETGRLVWFNGPPDRVATHFSTGAAVVSTEGIVYAASNVPTGGLIHAYRLNDGSLLWRKVLPMAANQAVAVGKLAEGQGLSVVAGIGENPGFPAMLRFLLLPWDYSSFPVFWLPLSLVNHGLVPAMLLSCFCTGCAGAAWHGRKVGLCGFVRRWLFRLALAFLWVFTVPVVINHLAASMQDQPVWLWGTPTMPARLVALDATTGEYRWTYDPQPFTRLACMGDEENIALRVRSAHFSSKPVDPICLPDSWAQAVIDGAGTTFAGFEDGRLYAVRDGNGDGIISSAEVSSYDLGAAFQGSQALAPGLFAVVPCGGGLFVWRT